MIRGGGRGVGGRHSVGRKRAAALAEPEEPLADDITQEVAALFSKVKGYAPPNGGLQQGQSVWKLPDPALVLTEPPHTHPALQELKRSLNTVKNQLSDKDLNTWHTHTCGTNRAGTVTTHLRNTVNAELCTQAWAKFYEVLSSFEVVPLEAVQQGELCSLHLCEAPGGFLSALNHFLRSGGGTSGGVGCDWSWLASTLNPYHEALERSHGVADDRLLLPTLPRVADDRLLLPTLPRWFFGSLDTGDVMQREHLMELMGLVRRGQTGQVQHANGPDSGVSGVGVEVYPSGVGGLAWSGGAHLVTCDGSFDCQGDPGEQESSVAPLLLCEAVTALMVLAPRGSLVIKAFTLLEHSSVCVCYLLACCFKQVCVFKPATSKAGNSEVYLVCVGFTPPPRLRPLLAKLLRVYGADMTRGGSVALFPVRCIPDSFLRQHEELCSFFHCQQVATISQNLRLYGNMGSEVTSRLERIRESVALHYIQRYQVRPLPRKLWLSRGGSGSSVCSVSSLGAVWSRLWGGGRGHQHHRHHQHSGSFQERQHRRTHTWRQRLAHTLAHTPLSSWLHTHLGHQEGVGVCVWGPGGAGHDPNTWYIREGAALTQVSSSPFCEPVLLGLLNQSLIEEEVLNNQPEAEKGLNSQSEAEKGTHDRVRGQRIPTCFDCVATPPHALLAEVCGRSDITSCLVLGDASWWGVSEPSLGGVSKLEFLPVPCPSPWLSPCPPLLHDGDPAYQSALLGALLGALPRLREGSALVVPLRSALTRLTCGLLLALHLSFRCITYRCPAPGPNIALLCLGYTHTAHTHTLHTLLTHTHQRVNTLLLGEGGTGDGDAAGGGGGVRDALCNSKTVGGSNEVGCVSRRQVLQVCPMDELLRGEELPNFLCSLNASVARQRLHLLLQHTDHSNSS
ncbi:cap-specific mRNA (nucleoside-2'-O-)-methyltransferase 2 [Engraulis encrasicolus]|uniref:cap-specific mRNA (nucleoside-2'-O-)-methyltransferase 2 n=1 Tax=Engraulis encrasicolus TaxID=184585 RepID=UPI002FD42B8E